MKWRAQWIWDGGEVSPRNAWRCFRGTFELQDGACDGAQIHITADSRYQLWVNGAPVGRGPVRSWPFAQMYDSYPVGHLLNSNGPNVIAVLVHHYGLSTFSYLRGRGGLLVQLDLPDHASTSPAIATDESWRVSTHHGYDSRAPRLSLQLGFTEQYNAAKWDDSWMLPSFDDRSWVAAQAIGPIGCEPWVGVVPRDIPPLAEEKMVPSRIESFCRVEPVTWTTTVDVRSLLDPGGEEHADFVGHAGYLATIVRVPVATEIVLGFPSATTTVFGPISVNGVVYQRDQLRGTLPERYLDVELRSGDNWLVFNVTALDHGNGFHVGIDSESTFELVSPLEGGSGASPFAAMGPFPANPVWPSDATWRTGRMTVEIASDRERYKQAATVASHEELESLGDLVRAVPPALTSQTNVFASCVWVRARTPVPSPAGLQMLASSNGTPVELPRFETGDSEIVVDFGRILSGFLEFEVEAPEGAVLDFYGFEFIRDGQRQDTFARITPFITPAAKDASASHPLFAGVYGI